jgi:hypothetical protein
VGAPKGEGGEASSGGAVGIEGVSPNEGVAGIEAAASGAKSGRGLAAGGTGGGALGAIPGVKPPAGLGGGAGIGLKFGGVAGRSFIIMLILNDFIKNCNYSLSAITFKQIKNLTSQNCYISVKMDLLLLVKT